MPRRFLARAIALGYKEADSPSIPAAVRNGTSGAGASLNASVLPSGLLDLSPSTIERLPDRPGHFRMRTSGQRVMLAGHAGQEGLRETIRELWRARAVAGLATVDYEVNETPEAAESAAAEDVRMLRPLYNDGLPRYRNPDGTLPTTGRPTRRAMYHP